jgi:hypothetical protein
MPPPCTLSHALLLQKTRLRTSRGYGPTSPRGTNARRVTRVQSALKRCVVASMYAMTRPVGLGFPACLLWSSSLSGQQLDQRR